MQNKSIKIKLPNQTDNFCINVAGPRTKDFFQLYITRTDVGFVLDIYDTNGENHIESITLWDDDFPN